MSKHVLGLLQILDFELILIQIFLSFCQLIDIDLPLRLQQGDLLLLLFDPLLHLFLLFICLFQLYTRFILALKFFDFFALHFLLLFDELLPFGNEFCELVVMCWISILPFFFMLSFHSLQLGFVFIFQIESSFLTFFEFLLHLPQILFEFMQQLFNRFLILIFQIQDLLLELLILLQFALFQRQVFRCLCI